jgi:hypothetical protein
MSLVGPRSEEPVRASKWPLVTAALVLPVYLLTLAPDLTWSHGSIDGGELVTAAVTLGVPHPPGYPTYVLLGKMFSYLPFSSVAYRFNLFSAVSVTVAAAFVTSITTGVLKTVSGDNQSAAAPRQLVTVATGLSFALAPLVWGQALIAEVYGLNLAFLAAFLWALLGKRPAWLVGLLLGLSVTAPLTSLLMLPLAALVPRRQWLPLGLGLVLGLTPFLAVPWLARTDSPVVWGNPTTAAGWWWLVSGRLYHSNLFALPPSRVWPRLLDWSGILLRQFTWIGLPLMVLGLYQARKVIGRPALWLLGTAVLYFVYAVGYNTPDAVVLLLPLVLLLSVLLAPGLQQLGWLAPFLPLVLLLINFKLLDLSDDRMVRPLANQLFQAAPPAAILLTPGDQTIFTLWYFHHVEGQRPDIVLVDSNLFAFDWYRERLQEQHPHLNGLEKDSLDSLRLNKRPVCSGSMVAANPETPVAISCLED